MTACDVVVLTRTPNLFARCVKRVPKWANGIVIDNAGSDEIDQIATDCGWTCHRPGHNTSFSEGVNLGFGLGSAERVLLLNDDALLTPGSLEAMLRHNEPIVGALIVASNGLVEHAGVSWSGRYPVQIGWRTPTFHEYREHLCAPAEAVTFAVAVVSREVHEAAGGLDESYWYGYEDVDFCAAAAEKGFRSFMCYEATALHDGRATRGQADDQDGLWKFMERWTLHTDRGRRALEKVGLL